MASIACYGAANLDRTARCIGELVLRTSNPVTTRQSIGGVARNVAANLTHLGNKVRLTAAIGGDSGGEELVRALTADGIEARGMLRFADATTASYTAVLDRDGELLIGLADMAIYDRITPEALAPTLEGDSFHGRFVDANLPPACLDAATSRLPQDIVLAASTVSTPKAARLLPFLDRLDVVFANRAEASVLSDIDIQNDADALRAADAIRRRGTTTVFVTLGPRGAVVVGADDRLYRPAIPGAARDVVGAGDAFASGAMSALLAGKSLHDALIDGLATASLTVEVDGPNDPGLSPARVAERTRDARGEK
jgi:pseudouridine kinase